MAKIGFLYLYGCGGREDGLNFCVQAMYVDMPNPQHTETLALFRHPGDAVAFAYEKQRQLGCMVHFMPSFETDVTRFAMVSYRPTEADREAGK